jgi:hypothetical protein
MATVAPSGAGDQPAVEKRDGGTVINGGTFTSESPMTKNLTLADIADDFGEEYGSKVIAKVDGGEYSDRVGVSGAVPGSVTGGTTKLGYDATATEWVVQAGNVTTTLGGVAYDGLIGGAAGPDPTRDFVAELETTRVYGDIDIDVYASGEPGYNHWVTKSNNFAGDAPGAVQNYVAPSGAGDVNSNDLAANTTRAVPGQLVYMQGGKIPFETQYKAKDSAES